MKFKHAMTHVDGFAKGQEMEEENHINASFATMLQRK